MITTGVLGGTWRAWVTPWGAVEPWDGSAALEWAIAADDRWHVPAREAAVRQRRVDGTAVVETRVRVPDGDVVHRVYSVADHGGLTVVEVENASPLPIAVAFTRSDLLTPRPPSAPIEGVDLPAGSVAFPIGHRATLTVALRHTAPAAGALPAVPTASGAARGWSTIVDRAGRFLLPDDVLTEAVVAARSELALCGPADPEEAPAEFVVGVGQLVRMGERADPWLPEVARALESVGRNGPHDWLYAAALDAAAVVFATAGEQRALRDVGAVRAARPPAPELPSQPPPGGARLVAWVENTLGRGAVLLPGGLPPDWVGANFEVYGLPTGPASTVSYAVRWHGPRPAVLWEHDGEACRLTSPALAPEWATTEAKGEALWPAPAAVPGGRSI